MSRRDSQTFRPDILDRILRTAVYLTPGLVLLLALARTRDQAVSPREQVPNPVPPNGSHPSGRSALLRFAACDYYDP